MVKKRSIGAKLHIGDINDDELVIILKDHFPRGATFQPNEVEYRTRADDTVLTLKYRDGKIIDAEAWSTMTTELEQEICAAVVAAQAQGGTAVYRCTMFSGRPVQGTWRYRNEFQIVPAPPEAPRPRELWADGHPFVADLVFEKSSNQGIEQLRYVRKSADLVLVLNLLLNTRITMSTNRVIKHWVWATQGSEPPVIWTSEGYMIPNFTFIVDELSNVDSPPLSQASAGKYYSRGGTAEDLTIPVELTDLLDAFSTLNTNDRERFLRACYWYHMSSVVWRYSQSLHLASLVNSIECLSSVGPVRQTPEGPHKLFVAFMRRFGPQNYTPVTGSGPTALFKSFMKRLAPGAPSGRVLDSIYKARSNITHGERLLHFDIGASLIDLSQNETRDREVSDSAVILCRGALINWLWNQRPTASGEHLVTQGLPSSKPAKPGTKSGITIITPNS